MGTLQFGEIQGDLGGTVVSSDLGHV
jgi:hypothetical protein